MFATFGRRLIQTGEEMTKSVAEARKAQTRAFIESVRASDSLTPRENDDRLNDSCRGLIKAIHQEHGEAWLGRVSLHGKYRTIERGGEGINPIWLWDGSKICNFDCSFVIPCDDEQLRQLILDRDRSGYTGTADDYVTIQVIHNRVEELGGYFLNWS
jgi:hypothetical protein